MSDFLQMVSIQSVLFLYMLVGYFCVKTKLLDHTARKCFTDFVIYITLPCMVFQSFAIEFTPQTLRSGAMVITIATGMALTALLLGKVLYMRCKDPHHKRIMQYGTLVSNSGFAGLPLVEAAFGAEGLFLGGLFIIPTRILMWSAGISLFTDAPRRERIKNVLLNPGILAVEAGVIRMLCGWQLPTQLDKAVSAMGNCTTPLAMAVVGMILASIDAKTVFEGKAFVLSAVRQLGLPLLLLAVLRPLGINTLTLSVVVLLTGMPIGSTTAILAAKYGMAPEFASKCVFISTITSLITVPLLTLFL